MLHPVIIGHVKIVKCNPLLACYCGPWFCGLAEFISMSVSACGRHSWGSQGRISFLTFGTEGLAPKRCKCLQRFSKRDRQTGLGVEEPPGPASTVLLPVSLCAAAGQQECGSGKEARSPVLFYRMLETSKEPLLDHLADPIPGTYK